MSIDDQVANLTAELGRVKQALDQLLSRPSEGPPPATQIMPIVMFGSAGQIQEWSGSSCVPAGSTDPRVAVANACGALVRMNYQSQQWEELCGLKIGVLLDELLYASTSGARFQVYNGPWGGETANEVLQVGAWMLHPGDSIAAGTEGFCAMCDGRWYMIAAQCQEAGGSGGSSPCIPAQCTWTYNANNGFWFLTTPCSQGCGCGPPGIVGTFDGQTVNQPCNHTG